MQMGDDLLRCVDEGECSIFVRHVNLRGEEG